MGLSVAARGHAGSTRWCAQCAIDASDGVAQARACAGKATLNSSATRLLRFVSASACHTVDCVFSCLAGKGRAIVATEDVRSVVLLSIVHLVHKVQIHTSVIVTWGDVTFFVGHWHF